jgi:hypothetical protein
MASAIAQSCAVATALPPAVTDLIGRRTSCVDWTAKSHTNPSLASGLASTLDTLRCSDVPKEEVAVRKLYHRDAHIIAALDAKWVKVVQRVPVRPVPNASTCNLQK